MQVKITAELNQDKDGRIFGWYLVGSIERKHGLLSRYETDAALISILYAPNIDIYRNYLKECGATVLANGRTCFPTKEMVEEIIPVILDIVNYEILY